MTTKTHGNYIGGEWTEGQDAAKNIRGSRPGNRAFGALDLISTTSVPLPTLGSFVFRQPPQTRFEGPSEGATPRRTSGRVPSQPDISGHSPHGANAQPARCASATRLPT